MAKLKITLKKSVIGSNDVVKANIKSLGLKKTNDSTIQEDTPDILGKIERVKHLISVEKLA